MILIFNKTGSRLCQDNRWRDFANYGDYPECVKTYKSLGAAINKAKRINGIVVQLQKDDTIDAAGTIIKTIPAGVGYVTYTHHKFTEFVVWKKENDLQNCA